MGDQGTLDFEGNSSHRNLTAELEAALRLSRRGDPDSEAAAASAFKELERLALGCADPKTDVRVYEPAGDHYFARRAFGVAKEKYCTALESAKLIAVTSDDGVADVERLRFKLTKVRNAHDPFFKAFEEVAGRSYSYEQRNIAWAGFEQDRGNTVERLAARGFGSKDDFRRRLDAAKWDPADEEDEEVRW